MSSLTVQDYRLGWICALHEELAASIAMLDEEYEMLAQQDPQDRNSYVLGRIHQHHVVIACMSEGVDGLVSAANVARDMARTFPNLRIGLMVGIGGGIPNIAKGIDVRLGDIVVSTPQGGRGGVVQYDKGKAEHGGQFVVKGQLNQPPALLLNAVTHLRALHAMRPTEVVTYIDEAIKQNPTLKDNEFSLPSEPDRLYCSVCDRDMDSDVAECTGLHVQRKLRTTQTPLIHHGLIASANQVVKDAAVRDRLRDEFGAICVETEAAGLMNDFPCLVIRGICDYADMHKNDTWHSYAAMTAAAYAKELLQYVSLGQTSQEQPIRDVLGPLGNIYRTSKAQLEATQVQIQQSNTQYEKEKRSKCHQTFKVGPYEEQKNLNPERVNGTCQWVLTHPQYTRWRATHRDDLLWISADPGCGKSVLAKSLIDHELVSTSNHSMCYFFFKDNDEQNNLTVAFCALLHQLFSQQPWLIEHAIPAWEKAGSQLTKDVSELWRILLTAAKDAEAYDVTCLCDAMDECRPSDQRSLINMLARFYVDISSSPPNSGRGRLKFLVTSRPYDTIQTEFQRTLDNLPTIRLRGEDENDQIHQEIDLVIHTRVNEIGRDLLLDDRTKEQLTNRLLRMEHRTYLWLYLAIENVAETYRHSLRPREAMIESLPATVEAAYEGVLAQVSGGQKANVRKILLIVAGARRALTIGELAIALGIATNTQIQSQSLDQIALDPKWLERHIRHWCGLFIFINHARVYLIHQTAKEFLIRSNHHNIPSPRWKHSLDPQEIAKEMTRICTTFISLDKVTSFNRSATNGQQAFNKIGSKRDFFSYLADYWPYDSREKKKDKPISDFLSYSAEYWPHHLREAESLIDDDAWILNLQRLYDPDGNLYKVWFPRFWRALKREESDPQMNPIQLAAFLGHKKVLESMWQLHSYDFNIDASDGLGRTALMLACEYNHQQVVQTLLDKGADINARGRIGVGALYTASYKGHEQVVHILLNNQNLDVNAKGGKYDTALQAASYKGHERVVHMLLNNESTDVNAKGGEYGTALQAASYTGHERVVHMLLAKNADVNIRRGLHGTALYAASEMGHEQVVHMLLAKNADVNAQDGPYGFALYAASKRGHEQVVRMLLDTDVDVHAEGQHGTALRVALSGGHERIVQMLLSKLSWDSRNYQHAQRLLSALLQDDQAALSDIFADVDRTEIIHQLKSLGLPKFEQISGKTVRFYDRKGWQYVQLSKLGK